MADRPRRPWEGSTRRSRLPDNWDSVIKPEALRLNPERVCHWCTKPGGTSLDHKVRGDRICLKPGVHSAGCQCNLDWIHDRQDVRRGTTSRNCHGEKTGREAAAARTTLRRDAEVHPAFR